MYRNGKQLVKEKTRSSYTMAIQDLEGQYHLFSRLALNNQKTFCFVDNYPTSAQKLEINHCFCYGWLGWERVVT